MNGAAADSRRSTAAKYLGILRISLQTALTYRANVLTGFLSYTLFLFVFFNLWRAIYAGGGVEGLTFQQMIWYLCMTELITFGASVRVNIDKDVKSGEIAYQLIRPYSYIGYQFSTVMGEMLYRLTCFSILGVLIGFLMVGPIDGFRLWTLPLSFLTILLGIVLNFFILTAIRLTAFKIEETFGLYLVYQKLVFMLGTFIPIEFLPGWLQMIAKNLPFSYVTWGPARLTVGFTWGLFGQVITAQALWLAIVLGIIILQYRNGIKNLQGQGG